MGEVPQPCYSASSSRAAPWLPRPRPSPSRARRALAPSRTLPASPGLSGTAPRSGPGARGGSDPPTAQSREVAVHSSLSDPSSRAAEAAVDAPPPRPPPSYSPPPPSFSSSSSSSQQRDHVLAGERRAPLLRAPANEGAARPEVAHRTTLRLHGDKAPVGPQLQPRQSEARARTTGLLQGLLLSKANRLRPTLSPRWGAPRRLGPAVPPGPPAGRLNTKVNQRTVWGASPWRVVPPPPTDRWRPDEGTASPSSPLQCNNTRSCVSTPCHSPLRPAALLPP